ncbi:MAG: methyltransferase domain-containing protein [Alphaproteobacteria bacterium]|nr:methyltransferase domain-containing protein [Alphaproteobacteria bacterium]MDP6567026.1 methyltransferase domain-containing protein [Alphaproteobacteria bacterium]MDP6816275.1 methyltransferase domain-containing protein [Alphaproteobacteria bacterium]
MPAEVVENSDPPHCQVCGGGDCSPLIRHRDWTYHRCADCGLVFLHPMLDAAALAELYSNPDSAGTRAYFRKVGSKLRRARRRVALLAHEVSGGPAGKQFLDVGCSGGFTTEAARQAGFQAWGIDPDADAVAHARQHYPGSRFEAGGLEDFADSCDVRFDAVYCSEVLEHVADANRFAAALSSLMTPDGVLYLTTPDIGHWRRPRRLPAWDVFTPPHHCLFFSSGNLRRLLARHHLEIYRRRPAFKPGLKVLARKLGED